MLAVQEGKDDLAKQALGRYNEHLQGAQAASRDLGPPQGRDEQLKLLCVSLHDKIEEQAEEEHPGGARQSGQSPAAIQETMSGCPTRAPSVVRAMAERDRGNERKAIAAASSTRSLRRCAGSQFESLEYKGSSDQQLIELKARMAATGGSRPGQAAQPRGCRRARRRGHRGRRRGEQPLTAPEGAQRRRVFPIGGCFCSRGRRPRRPHDRRSPGHPPLPCCLGVYLPRLAYALHRRLRVPEPVGLLVGLAISVGALVGVFVDRSGSLRAGRDLPPISRNSSRSSTQPSRS